MQRISEEKIVVNLTEKDIQKLFGYDYENAPVVAYVGRVPPTETDDTMLQIIFTKKCFTEK